LIKIACDTKFFTNIESSVNRDAFPTQLHTHTHIHARARARAHRRIRNDTYRYINIYKCL